MLKKPTLLIVLCCLVAAVFLCSCDRSDNENQATHSAGDENPSNASSAANGEQAEAREDQPASVQNPNDGGAPQQDISLDRLASDGEYERIDDLPAQSLPPIPENASRSTGLYEKTGERIGLVLVKYPREGFAKPHIEDITHRNKQGQPVAIIAHGREVVEVRAADSAAALRVANELAVQLAWPTVTDPEAVPDQEVTTP